MKTYESEAPVFIRMPRLAERPTAQRISSISRRRLLRASPGRLDTFARVVEPGSRRHSKDSDVALCGGPTNGKATLHLDLADDLVFDPSLQGTRFSRLAPVGPLMTTVAALSNPDQCA